MSYPQLLIGGVHPPRFPQPPQQPPGLTRVACGGSGQVVLPLNPQHWSCEHAVLVQSARFSTEYAWISAFNTVYCTVHVRLTFSGEAMPALLHVALSTFQAWLEFSVNSVLTFVCTDVNCAATARMTCW